MLVVSVAVKSGWSIIERTNTGVLIITEMRSFATIRSASPGSQTSISTAGTPRHTGMRTP